MTISLLLDLDGTLLDNDIGTFLPAYLGAFSEFIAPYYDPAQFTQALMASTKVMMENDHPGKTLKDRFDEDFYPRIKLEKVHLLELIGTFYVEAYPALRSVTRSVPGAVEFVEQAFASGHRVVIATNPLFPLTAIQQRLTWAGLSPDVYPFEFIASYELSHFAKPSPAYFAEILGRLGWPQNTVLVVGDDWENDILPANHLGLPAFWIGTPDALPSEISGGCLGVGSIDQIFTWLEGQTLEDLSLNHESSVAMKALMLSTPAVLDGITREFPARLWTTRPMPDQWCLTEIMCHLRDVESEVNLPRIRKILLEDNPFLSGEDTDPWAEQREYIRQDGQDAIQAFIRDRMEVLEMVSERPEATWGRPARHAIFGRTNLAELVRIIFGHDRLHIKQIHQTIQRLT